MRSKRIAAALILLASQTAGADDGHFTAITSMLLDLTAIEQADMEITAGGGEGTFTFLESTSEPFSIGEHGHMVCAVYEKGSATRLEIEAYCTMTDADGDQLHSLWTRVAGSVEEGEGHIELKGGTGRYGGITGVCGFDIAHLAAGRWIVATIECEWGR